MDKIVRTDIFRLTGQKVTICNLIFLFFINFIEPKSLFKIFVIFIVVQIIKNINL